jgi:hypothetical protein
MNVSDACKILGLTGELTPEITKKAYRKACAKYHPDRNPAGLEMMKAVNEAYAELKDHTGNADILSSDITYGHELFEALTKIMHCGLTIEVCGSWVWVAGETKQYKEILKEAGFKWAIKKMMWFYRPPGKKCFSRGSKSIDDIRATYGSERATIKQNKLKAA